MIKIAVCDDMENIAVGMQETIQKHIFEENIQVDAFTSGKNLFENTVKNRYNLIFLDIELEPGTENGLNGMQVSNDIKDLYPDVLIVFFTGNPNYRDELVNFEPFRYIAKPFDEAEVISAVDAAIKRINGWEETFFAFSTNGVRHHVNIKEVILFSSKRPYIEVKSIGNVAHFRGKMDDVEVQVKELSQDFLRPNKSFLVNKKYIKKHSSKELVMSNGERVTITRKYAKDFFENMQK